MTQNPNERPTDQASNFTKKAAVQASKLAEQAQSASIGSLNRPAMRVQACRKWRAT